VYHSNLFVGSAAMVRGLSLMMLPLAVSAGCETCVGSNDCYHVQWAAPCSISGSQGACENSVGVWCPNSPPSPSPSPVPTPVPTPVPSPGPIPGGVEIGYWDKTWSSSQAPNGATFGVAFSGWADPSSALADSAGVYNSLVGRKYISIGGGNKNGRFNTARLASLVSMLDAGKFSQYQGLAIDLEECYETGLAPSFLAVTAAAKAAGMETMVTISHSAPYGCEDKVDLMRAVFADSNTDYLSPQLYTSGAESEPDFVYDGISWEEYASYKGRIIPSIVDDTHYAATESFFAAAGAPVSGFVQWANVQSQVLV